VGYDYSGCFEISSYNDFLVDQFNRFFQAYATIYNMEKKRDGSVFQKRFKRILIKDEFRWRNMLAYIHRNPIHHKFEKKFKNWKYSSYLAFLSNDSTSIALKQVLMRFDEDLEKAKKMYIAYHQDFKMEKVMNDLYLDYKL
jgi:hypothetical protein